MAILPELIKLLYLLITKLYATKYKYNTYRSKDTLPASIINTIRGKPITRSSFFSLNIMVLPPMTFISLVSS